MECPHCKRINPETTQRCDCGYDFTTKTLEEPYDRSHSIQTSRLAIVAGVMGIATAPLPPIAAVIEPLSVTSFHPIVFLWLVAFGRKPFDDLFFSRYLSYC